MESSKFVLAFVIKVRKTICMLGKEKEKKKKKNCFQWYCVAAVNDSFRYN